jgi:hypothetical protein
MPLIRFTGMKRKFLKKLKGSLIDEKNAYDTYDEAYQEKLTE